MAENLKMVSNTSEFQTNVDITYVDATYVLISNLVSFLSLSGCLVIIACYISLKEIRTTSRLLLVFLSFADIFLAVSTLLQTGTYYRSPQFLPESSFMCQTAAGMMVFAHVCCALWTMAVTFYLFLCVSMHLITVANRILFLFHVFCWVMPLVVSVGSDITGVYGYNLNDLLVDKHPTACWISDRVLNPNAWYLLTVEGWVLAAFVLACLLYIPISFSIYCKKNKGIEIEGDEVIEQLAIITANEQLRFIPVIYVCTRLWGTAYFLFTRYPENSRLRSYDYLLIMKAIGDNCQGLANAIFFCLATKQIRKIMRTRVFKCCLWANKQRVIAGERWIRVPTIVRAVVNKGQARRRNIDGSDLDLSGISLDLPPPDADLGSMVEDEVIFERE